MIKNKQFNHSKKCNYLDDSMINGRCELKKENKELENEIEKLENKLWNCQNVR